MLPVAIGADGGELGVPVHVLVGGEDGPTLVVMAAAHGYELQQISVIRELVRVVDCDALVGTLLLVPVANPVAFEMGTRCSWMDGLWGDSGNMNRLWPGRANGWLTERFCAAIASQVIAGATAVIDLHACTNGLDLAYGYLGPGEAGALDYEISRAFGHEILVQPTQEEVVEKRQTSGTSKVYVRSQGIAQYSCEIGEFYGLGSERGSSPQDELFRGVPEVGVTGVSNVMKLLGMVEGELRRPRVQVRVSPELNLRPSHGGLLISHYDKTSIGTAVPKGTVLGTLVSPYSFKVLEEITAPFDESLLLATPRGKPFSKVLPGEFAYIVADHSRTVTLE